MDVRDLIRVVTARWWLVVPVFLLVFGSAVYFTLQQVPRYRSVTTYVVRPTIGEAQDLLGALGIVSRQSEITSTYVEIASSQRIRREAVARSGLTGADLRDTDVATRLLAGTNVLEITTLSPDPEVARRLAEAIGVATSNYVRGLYGDVFGLDLLDSAQANDRPVEPNVPLYVMLGSGVAAVFAVGAAFALEMVRGARTARPRMEAADESGAVSEAYFAERLAYEMHRSRRTGRPFSIGLLDTDGCNVMQRLSHSAQMDAMRRVASIVAEHIGRGEIVGRVGPRVFAILMPERDSAEAWAVVSFLGARARIRTLDAGPSGEPIVLEPAIAVVTYLDARIDVPELLVTANRTLDRARSIHDARCAGSGAAAAVPHTPRAATDSLWTFPPLSPPPFTPPPAAR
jgi:GGDEF domain-containing protein/capsular polysaccharide biosynthesis protein